MKYSIEEINRSEKKILFTVESEIMKKAIDSELNKIKKEAKVPGFRPGKTPRQVIVDRYYPLALNYAQENVIKEMIGKFADENEQLKIISTPEVSDLKMNDDDSMDFSVRIEVFPELVIENYKGIEIKRTKRTVTEDAVEEALKSVSDRSSSFIDKIDETIVEGDYVNLDFQIFEEDKKIDEVKNYSFYVNSLKDIPGFEEGLLGMKTGEGKEIQVKYPDDYIRENLRNKDVIYKVHVNSIKRKIIPEINDEFVQKNFPGMNTVDELRNDIKQRMLDENEKLQKDEMLQQLFDYIIEKNPFDIPPSFLQESVEKFKEDKINELTSYGYKREDILANLNEAIFKKDVSTNLKIEIIRDLIIKQENITVTEEEIEKKVEDVMSKLGFGLENIDAKQLEKYKHQLKHRYQHILQYEKVEDLLIGNAKIEEIEPNKEDKQEKNLE
ncbi:MAG: trigger factor [bacterium]|nr:trigger factor [bacterium]